MRARSILFLLALGALTGRLAAEGGDTTRSTAGEYSLVASAGGGLSIYSNEPEAPSFLDANTSITGLSGSFRIMWHPNHLLRLGLETGHTRMYSYTFSDDVTEGEVEVNAVPLLLVWSMPIRQRLEVFLGYGYYRVKSRLDYVTETRSAAWSMGWMAAASYTYPLSRDLGLGGELKWMNAAETRNTVFSAQMRLQWRFLRW